MPDIKFSSVEAPQLECVDTYERIKSEYPSTKPHFEKVDVDSRIPRIIKMDAQFTTRENITSHLKPTLSIQPAQTENFHILDKYAASRVSHKIRPIFI